MSKFSVLAKPAQRRSSCARFQCKCDPTHREDEARRCKCGYGGHWEPLTVYGKNGKHDERNRYTSNQEDVPQGMHFHFDDDSRPGGRGLESSPDYRNAGVAVGDDAADVELLRRDVALELEAARGEVALHPSLR